MIKYLFTVAVSMLTYFVTRHFDQKKLKKAKNAATFHANLSFLDGYSKGHADGHANGVRDEQFAETIRKAHQR